MNTLREQVDEAWEKCAILEKHLKRLSNINAALVYDTDAPSDDVTDYLVKDQGAKLSGHLVSLDNFLSTNNTLLNKLENIILSIEEILGVNHLEDIAASKLKQPEPYLERTYVDMNKQNSKFRDL